MKSKRGIRERSGGSRYTHGKEGKLEGNDPGWTMGH